ncbi:MAG TPA: GNAT family N-acetyltransferase [Terriglobia bacterium]|nr:GNAT family N-acetyltransferase [Terriglobia bacterium]
MNMRCTVHSSGAEFLKACEEYLLRNESEHNLILGKRAEADANAADGTDVTRISIHRNDTVVGAAVLHPSERSLLSRMDEPSIHALIGFMDATNIRIDSVVGPIESSECFADSWKEITETTPRLLLHTGVYELTEVVFPDPDGRKLIPAGTVDPDLAFQYLLGFLADCFPDLPDPQRSARQMLERHAGNGTLFFWQGEEDSVPVSMAAKTRESRNGATISLVYTPPQLRKRGHASRMVAALSDRCLKDGKRFCNLFADVKNPTSNAIYQEIGYRKIAESKHFRFS